MERKPYLFWKSVVEWILALGLMLILMPVLAVLVTLQKLTSNGPAFYSQVRLGRNARPFQILKLRTMTCNCEVRSGPVWASENDPRVTPMGRLLRRTHLDELPQLWNVVRGDMSLIGPRPERPEIAAEIERLYPEFRQRLAVRPGISGLAQMRLPADTDLEGLQRKLAHDLHYVRNVNLSLDARIAIATLFHFVAAAADSVSKCLVQVHAVQPPPNDPPVQVAPAALVRQALSKPRSDQQSISHSAACELPRAA